jgi:pimeloyl-ACP methyl ester carboxylesterase
MPVGCSPTPLGVPSTQLGDQWIERRAGGTMSISANSIEHAVTIAANGVRLDGDLSIPPNATGLVVFAHGSGSSRRSPRNRQVAEVLHQHRLATLLFDLLTPDEVAIDETTRHLRFDIGFLATRLVAVTDWIATQGVVAHLPIGYFGASTGAAAALVASADRPGIVNAVVSRGGRPDLAMPVLDAVRAATLLIVGGADYDVIPLNERAYRQLRSPKEFVLVDRATHLFEERGAIEQVSRLAADWFERYLSPAGNRSIDEFG